MTGALILATIAHWALPAMSEVMRLPDAVPADGEKDGAVTIVAARDEYEPGSFVVRSDVDLGKVRFELSELRNETGDVFPSEDLDLKFVKVWYQNRNAWFSYFGDTGFRLCPELLVNDEDLVRVDTAKGANYARLVGADGRTREQWLNPPHQMDVRPLTEGWRKGAAFMSMRPDFRDAETLQPVAMPANESKQFFLTVRTRKSTPAGLYRGVVQLKQSNNPSNRTILSIPVAVRVLDFVLPRPKTYLDPERDFLICSYHYLEIARILDENGGDRALAVRQLERILADQVAHGQTMHMLKTDILHPDGEAAMTIGLMKRVGMRTDTLVGGVWGVKDPQTPVDVQRTDARRRATAFDNLIGHHRVYLSYGDEPQSAWIDSVRGVMEAYHDAGFGFFLAGDDNMFTRASEFVDWANLAQRPERKERVEFWKQMPDARVAWYGQMHVGPENPAFNRRQNGMAPYLAGYSAFANYAHHLGPYNDDRTTYRPMVFAYGVYGGVLDTIQWEGFREGVDDIRYATALVRLARRAIASGTPSLVRQGRRAIRELATFDPAAGDLATLRAEMTRHILALHEAVGDLSEDVPPAEAAVDADALVAKFNVAKEQDFRELATYGNFAASAEKLEGRFASRKAFSDVEAESALAAYWGAGRGADAAALVERLVAASPKMKEAEKVKLRFAARVAADGSSEGIARAVESARDADPKERVAAIEFAGSCANRLGDEGLLRRLWDARQAQFAPKPRRTMDVAYVRERMLGPESWARPELPASVQKLDRSYGGNLDFLVTDIATGGRGVSAQDAAKAVSEKPTVAAVCDDWGVHFRFVETNADAMRIERGEKSGGSWEIYLAPGADAPHTCLLLNVSPGAEVECANTQYETFGVRRLRTGRDSTRSQVVFSDGRIETHLSVSWENYGVRSLTATGEWEFEALRWGNAGNAAWNGTESIHGRSTWGRLRFALPEAARARIARRLLSKAVAAYRREKNSEKTFEGAIARWNDPGNGDAAFYAERVRPLEQELDAVCARVDAGLSDNEVLALAQEKLNALRDVRHRIAVLRADWLNGGEER